MGKKYREIVIIVALIMVMFVTLASFVYGEGYYFYPRNDKMEIEIPGSWEYEEIDASKRVDDVEQILHADNQKDTDHTEMGLFYMVEPSDEFIYFHNDGAEAKDYYNRFGKSAVEKLYAAFDGYELVSLSEAEIYNAEWMTYLKIVATVKDTESGTNFEQLIYLTATESIVHEIFIFSADNPNGTAAALVNEAEPIVESFYDYGYYEEIVDADYSDDSDTDGAHVKNLTIAGYSIIGIVALMFVVFALYNRRRWGANDNARRHRGLDGGYQSRNGGYQSRNSGYQSRNSGYQSRNSGYQNGSRSAFKEKASPNSMNASLSKTLTPRLMKAKSLINEVSPRPMNAPLNGASPRPMNAPINKASPRPMNAPINTTATQRMIHSDAGERYIESLHTLYKSGLLTKEELNQMLDKYERSRNR